MMNIEVNGKKVQAADGVTILEALNNAGIKVPTLCHMKGLPPSGACRICVVENAENGVLMPSCSFPAWEGMKILTHSPKALAARKTIVELLLANHPDDCLYCDRNNNCELQDLAVEFGVRKRKFSAAKNNYHIDSSSPAILRDPAKCILCGKCVRVCEEVQAVSAIDFVRRGSRAMISPAFCESLNTSSCVNCGQCVAVCPTGALVERSSIADVINALNDPEKIVVIQHAPAVSVSLAEEFGIDAGQDINGIMVAALRKIGFDKVFDTSFTADLTIMEEANELVERIKNGGKLPMITSCSPAWIKFAETFYPEFIENLSSCRSPQQMMGAVIKSYFAQKQNVDPSKIYSVSVMPCTAKKFEAERPEMIRHGVADIDAVLTTRELAKLIVRYGIDLRNLAPEEADTPFGTRSSAGKLFAGSGGVMEAAVRTAFFMLTGKNPESPVISGFRGLDGVKEVTLSVSGLTIKAAVVSSLGNAKKILEAVKKGEAQYHFIEVMSCPGGCINGGGQPRSVDRQNVIKRLKALYAIDEESELKYSHENPDIVRLYNEFFKKPGSHLAHELLHTHYTKRELLK
ncbi:MAG TPA: NADH-dependent [FeFe] hydrogenase, group A6 [bacterium]|nr:NADH-dependent [FeFe] hydrogenase, group A6 [bacterium]